MRDKQKINEKTHQLVAMTAEFCEKHLDDEYSELCEKLIRKMARKRNVPFLSGRMDIWASGILFALCRINFAFEPGDGPFTTRDELCGFFGTNKSTVSQKATKIQDLFKLTYWDDEFSTTRILEKDPFKDLVMVNGLIIPTELFVQKLEEEGMEDVFFEEDDGPDAQENDLEDGASDQRMKDFFRPPATRYESLCIVEEYPDHWRFGHPDPVDELNDEFYYGVDLMEEGQTWEAERIFRRVIRKSPQQIDAYHHLAMICNAGRRQDEALELWETAVGMGRDCFPDDFTIGTSLLEWSMIENRPFLRACHGLGLAYQRREKIAEALTIFNEMLDLNPNDNQGARELAVQCYFGMGDPKGVLQVCERYPGDTLGGTLYGLPLANFQLGNMTTAEKAMKDAIRYRRNIAKELLKKRHVEPTTPMDGYTIVGGKEEAYEYWTEFGRYWKATDGALEFAKTCIKRITMMEID